MNQTIFLTTDESQESSVMINYFRVSLLSDHEISPIWTIDIPHMDQASPPSVGRSGLPPGKTPFTDTLHIWLLASHN